MLAHDGEARGERVASDGEGPVLPTTTKREEEEVCSTSNGSVRDDWEPR